jgi:RHS repeat-associated protein
MLTDHLGTVRDLVNNGGSVVNHFTYDSFGKVLSATPGGVDTRYKFTGRELDAETGLYYYRARYFDANVGRFIGQDPIGFSAGDNNLYRYVGNSPLMATDPSGKYKVLIEYDEIAKIGHHARIVFERKNGLRIVYEASPLKQGSQNAIGNILGSAGTSGFLIPEPNTFGKPKYNPHPQYLTQLVYEDKECENDQTIELPIRNTFLALLTAKIDYSSLYRNSNSAAFQALENTFLENNIPGKARPQPKGKLWVPAWEINPFTGRVSPFAVPRDYSRTKKGTPIRSQPVY